MTKPDSLASRVALILVAAWALILPIAAAQNPAGLFDVRDYGAVGDGKTLDTTSIQAAIDACATSGGGRVSLHNGVFLSGTLSLKSHVTLYIGAGAVFGLSQGARLDAQARYGRTSD